MVNIIEDLSLAGIRFVYFSSTDERPSKGAYPINYIYHSICREVRPGN